VDKLRLVETFWNQPVSVGKGVASKVSYNHDWVEGIAFKDGSQLQGNFKDFLYVCRGQIYNFNLIEALKLQTSSFPVRTRVCVWGRIFKNLEV
jgi:hypothetical protein